MPAAETAGEQARTWQYFVEVEGDGGEVLHRRGSPEAPMALAVAAGGSANSIGRYGKGFEISG